MAQLAGAFPPEQPSPSSPGGSVGITSSDPPKPLLAEDGGRPDQSAQRPKPKPAFARRNSRIISKSPEEVSGEGGACEEENPDRDDESYPSSNSEHGNGNADADAADEELPYERSPPKAAKKEVRPEKKSSPPVVKSVARLCGSSRSKCGYCGGKRLRVLGVRDEYNEALIGDTTTLPPPPPPLGVDGGSSGSGSGSDEATISTEKINEATTSKSYGLLFDSIPHSTYEDLINRGWRRSGKHLYRPHNFESCCPAISIRLDVRKFASRCSHSQQQPSDVSPMSKAEDGGEFGRSILVGGSKSQRKVAKTILRGLESYNSKYRSNSIAYGTGMSMSSKGRAVTSVLSGDDSVHTQYVARMHLGNRSVGGSACGAVSRLSELVHPNKKSRKRSPDRIGDKLGEPTSPDATASNKDATGRPPLLVNQEYLQPLLDKLSGEVYLSITKIAMETVNCHGEACENGKEMEIPEWAWWKNGAANGCEKLPKWCAFKVSQPRAGSKGQRSSNTNGLSIMVSTSACAAASGRSRGDIDRSRLVSAAVDSLNSFALESSQQNNGADMIQVKEVSVHEKSGHVNVILDASPAAIIARGKSSLAGSFCTSTTSHIASNQRPPTKKSVDEPDPIAEFITRYQNNILKLNKIDESVCFQKRMPHQPRYLTVRSVPAHESSLQLEVHQLFSRYQAAVHGDFDPFFSTGEVPKEKDHSKEYVFYQQKNLPGFLDVDVAYNHLDEVQRSKIKSSYLTFYRFLCETPVARDEAPSRSENDFSSNEDGYDIHIPYGTYHQQYRLSTSKHAFDGPLIAVGVVDVLPRSLSSVYAFYDPVLSSSLELGKYTALREIEWVRRASRFRPDLHHYYLGYYIHSCQKMTYKAEYKPSELLCPVTLKWVDFEIGKKRLEDFSPVRHCCALYTNPPEQEDESNANERSFGIEDITLDIGEGEQHLIQLKMLNRQGREFVDPHVTEFAAEVGANMCPKFIIKLR